MKVRVFADLKGNSIEPVEQHVEPGTGKAMIAAGFAEEVLPTPIKHKISWQILQAAPSDAPYVLCKCNCRSQNKWWMEGATHPLETRHVIMTPDEFFVGQGEHVFIGGSNTGKFKIVIETAPADIKQEYRTRYAAWAKRYAPRPKKPSTFDIVQKIRDAAKRGQLTDDAFKRAQFPSEFAEAPRPQKA